MGKIILGYWNMRGKVERIRLMLEYLKLEYEMCLYDIHNQSEWFDNKESNLLELDFPNLPYLIEDDLKMSESWAIMRYLAHKNQNQLWPTPGKEEINCEIAAGVVNDFRTKFVLMIYNKDFDELKKDYALVLPAKLKLFEKYLADKTWLAGGKLTFVDFAFCETLDRHVMMYPNCLIDHKCLKQYFENFMNFPAIKAYRESNRFQKYPLHKPAAFWGHGP